MIKIVTSLCAVALGAGLVVAVPADASAPSPAYAGYAATVPSHIRGARVTLRVPTLSCTKKSSARSIGVGLFAHDNNGKTVSLFVQASCASSRATYATRYGSHGAGEQVAHGDLVRLILNGTTGYEIDNLTTGEGVDSGSAGGPGPQPVLTDTMLIGAQVLGTPPSGFRTVLSYARVNGTALAKVAHGIRTVPGKLYVGALKHDRFPVSSVH